MRVWCALRRFLRQDEGKKTETVHGEVGVCTFYWEDRKRFARRPQCSRALAHGKDYRGDIEVTEVTEVIRGDV